MLSRKFIIAVKLASVPAYAIAQEAGIDPSTLSKIMCGIVKVKPGDRRVLAVGRVLGIPSVNVFKGEQTNEKNQAYIC